MIIAGDEDMLKDIRATLTDSAAQYADTRTHLCRVAAAGVNDGRCTLTGAVLDQETLAAVLSVLAARFPDVSFDAVGVRVLRQRPSAQLTVATNLTGLYAEPSFNLEMVSQLLNGWTLELLDRRDRWTFVRQPDGYLGWAFSRYLTEDSPPVHTHLVCAPLSLVLAEPRLAATIITRVPGGTAVAVDSADGGWLHIVLAGGKAGWVPAASLRSLDALPNDADSRRAQMMADAAHFKGVPFLWGGCTALGIDCSGFAQLLHRLVGVTIPKDADMQYEAGRPIQPPYAPGDLFFFSDGSGEREITHVAVSRGETALIHSARSINGVYEDDLKANADLNARLIGARTYL